MAIGRHKKPEPGAFVIIQGERIFDKDLHKTVVVESRRITPEEKTKLRKIAKYFGKRAESYYEFKSYRKAGEAAESQGMALELINDLEGAKKAYELAERAFRLSCCEWENYASDADLKSSLYSHRRVHASRYSHLLPERSDAVAAWLGEEASRAVDMAHKMEDRSKDMRRKIKKLEKQIG